MARTGNLLAGIFLSSLSWFSYAQAVAPITAVTLYPGSATVVRTARVEAGMNRLVVGDLTTQFAIPTLRVDADPGIRIGQIVTQDAARTESSNAAQAAIEAKTQALKDQAAELEVKAGAADIVKGYLERTGGSPEHTSPALDGKALTGVVAAINQAATEALTRKHQVAVQKRDIDAKIEALTRDLRRVRSESRDSRTVTIQLTADRPGLICLSYQLNGAGWRPAYRAELHSATSAVTLERLAQVSQKTGEEWKGVRLSLSTAQPRISPVAVSPEPWLLSYIPPKPAEDRAQRFAPAPAPAAAPAARMVAPGATPYQPPTFQTDGAFATEFVVPSPVTLPADGREVSLPLARLSAAGKQRLQVTPRLSTVAVVTGEIDRQPGVWPQGNLQAYRDGNYVGATSWDPKGSEKWSFAFGPDELLQVRVNPVKGDSGTAGVFEKRNQRRIADQITLRSNHQAPVEVLVIEASPVSTSEEIKVHTVFTPRPTVESWEQRRGVVAWTRTIAPQETATIDVDYTIEYPKDGRLTGLR